MAVDPVNDAARLIQEYRDQTDSEVYLYSGGIEPEPAARFVEIVCQKPKRRTRACLFLTTHGGNPHAVSRGRMERRSESYPATAARTDRRNAQPMICASRSALHSFTRACRVGHKEQARRFARSPHRRSRARATRTPPSCNCAARARG